MSYWELGRLFSGEILIRKFSSMIKSLKRMQLKYLELSSTPGYTVSRDQLLYFEWNTLCIIACLWRKNWRMVCRVTSIFLIKNLQEYKAFYYCRYIWTTSNNYIFFQKPVSFYSVLCTSKLSFDPYSIVRKDCDYYLEIFANFYYFSSFRHIKNIIKFAMDICISIELR